MKSYVQYGNCECDNVNIAAKNGKYIKFVAIKCALSSCKCIQCVKTRFQLGSAGGAYDAPPDLIVGCGGVYFHFPATSTTSASQSWHLDS